MSPLHFILFALPISLCYIMMPIPAESSTHAHTSIDSLPSLNSFTSCFSLFLLRSFLFLALHRFYANDYLGTSIAYPIISVGPSLVGCLWGALVFGEIQGKRNYMLLAGAFFLVTAACLCISISK